MAKVRVNKGALNKLIQGIKVGTAEGIKQSIDEDIIPRAQELTPVDTGELIDSYTSKVDIGRQRGTVSNTAPHYGFIELGTSRIKNFHKGPPRNDATIFRTSGAYKGLGGARMTQQAVDEARAKGLLRRQIEISISQKIR